MAMYTKAQIKTEIRALLKEPTQQFFLDTEIEKWIDQAAVDISSKTLCYETAGTLTLVAGKLEYPEPDGCLEVYACRYQNKGLVKIHPRQIGHLVATTSGPPIHYYHFAKKVGLDPIPGSAEVGKKVPVLCSRETDNIANIPDHYQPFAILFCLYKAKLKDNKYAQAGQLLTQYLNGAIFHRQDLHERGVDSKDMLKIPDRTVVKENA